MRDEIAAKAEQRTALQKERPPTADAKQGDAEKIETIRTVLGEIARKEDEAETVNRISENVRLFKEQKEHPLPPERTGIRSKKHRRTAKNASSRHHKAGASGKKKQSLLRGVLPRRGDRKSEIVRKTVFWLSTCVFVGCMIWMGVELTNRYETQKKYDDISQQYGNSSSTTTTQEVAATEAPTEAVTEEEPTYSLLPGAENLLQLSEDVVGYITIPDTVVDYPLMQNTEDDEGEEYFLSHDFYGNDSHLGSIFLDFRCSFDAVGADGHLSAPNSDNLIVYGHNMLDESMFGSLRRYQTDDSYYEQHPLILLNSNYEEYVYKIYGYFIADAVDTSDTRFEYWNEINFADETAFYDYVNEVKRRTLRLTNVDVRYGDSLLTLSTCNGTFDNARLVICARRLRDGEDAYEGTTGSTLNSNIKWPTVYYNWNNDTYDPNAEFVPYGETD
jgi:sortase B